MFNFKSAIIFLLLPAFVASGAVSATETTKTATSKQTMTASAKNLISDSTITSKVKSNLLLDKDIKSLSISVTTDKGVVTLSGMVKDKNQKKKILLLAQKVQGVKKIKDELVINGAAKQ